MHHLWISWTIGKKNSIGRHGHYISRTCRGGYNLNSGEFSETIQDRRLYAEVKSNYFEFSRAVNVRLSCGDLGDQIFARCSLFALRSFVQLRLGRRTKSTWHCPRVTQNSCKPSRVNAGDARDLMALQERI